MNKEENSSNSVQDEEFSKSLVHSIKLNSLKHRVNIQGEKITNAQEEIQKVRNSLIDAKIKLEIMNKRHTDKSS